MKDIYVITGGGSGMGLAIAKELGKKGAVKRHMLTIACP